MTKESSNGGTATFVDNRPSTVTQRKLQEGMTVQRTTTKPPQDRRAPQGSARFRQIATAMGHRYGVDTSGLVATHNSSFPASLNAEATIQGNKIHFAPGRDTNYNMQHEVSHAIDNALHGTPKGDHPVQGHSDVNKREDVVVRMAKAWPCVPVAYPFQLKPGQSARPTPLSSRAATQCSRRRPLTLSPHDPPSATFMYLGETIATALMALDERALRLISTTLDQRRSAVDRVLRAEWEAVDTYITGRGSAQGLDTRAHLAYRDYVRGLLAIARNQDDKVEGAFTAALQGDRNAPTLYRGSLLGMEEQLSTASVVFL